MPAPYDYTMQVQSPMQALQQGFALGASALQAREAAQAIQMRQMQQQREATRQARLDEVLPGYLEEIQSGKMPGLSRILEVESLMPDQQRSMFEQYRKSTNDEKRRNTAGTGLKIVSGLLSGDGQYGLGLLEEQLAAAKNSGDQQSVNDLEGLLKVAKINPRNAAATFLPQIYQVDPEFVKGSLEAMEKFKGLSTEMGGAFEVQSTENLPGGYTKQVGKNAGQVVLVAPDGVPVPPEQAGRVIEQIYAIDARNATSKAEQVAAGTRAAQLRADIMMGGEAAAAVEAGKSAQAAGVKAFEKLGPARQQIQTIDKAIAAIDRGASTGIVSGLLPSVSQASRELDLLRNELGLAVIGATTFGALSEGELKLALDTGGIDVRMAPQELKGLLQRKKAAQIKLADELQKAARFLTKPGNTINDWIEQNVTVEQAGGDVAPGVSMDAVRAERERRARAAGRR